MQAAVLQYTELQNMAETKHSLTPSVQGYQKLLCTDVSYGFVFYDSVLPSSGHQNKTQLLQKRNTVIMCRSVLFLFFCGVLRW